MDSTEEKWQRRLSNLKPFSSTYQPKNRRSRKGIPNKSTVFRLAIKELEKKLAREERKPKK